MAKRYNPPQAVFLEWVDIQQHDGGPWLKVKKADPAKCVAVGYLVYEDDENVTLAQSWSQGEAFGVWTYPRGCVVNIKELSTPHP